MDSVGPERRSPEEITKEYPKLGTWLDRYGLRSLARGQLYMSSTARADVANGRKLGGSSNRFQINLLWQTDEELAIKIADRLLQEPELAKKVCARLSYRLYPR